MAYKSQAQAEQNASWSYSSSNVSSYGALRKQSEQFAGAATYNGTNIFDFGESIGMQIGSMDTIQTDIQKTSRANYQFGLGEDEVKPLGISSFGSYNQDMLKSYYEAFTTVEKTRKAQLQAFGKEQATLAGQTFATPASPVTSTASQSILGS